MRLLDIGHGAGVIFQPRLAEERIPSQSDKEMDDHKDPYSKMMDFVVHERLSEYPDAAIWIASQLIQQVNVDRTVIVLVSKP
jgi:uncharacterized protein YifN (PemK superfamily)